MVNGMSVEPPKEKKYSLHLGASWMDLDGTVYKVPGFHVEWIRKYQEFVGGNFSSVAEVILQKRWLSVVVYTKGHLEICISDLADADVVDTLWDFLNHNHGEWENVLLMPLSEEGFLQFSSNVFPSKEKFNEFLRELKEKG
jgi:hypothetical protein